MVKEDTLLVGFTKGPKGDLSILIVARKTPGETFDVVNAFEGDEAEELYKKLVTVGRKEEDKSEPELV